MSNLTAAIYYARHGIAVLPLWWDQDGMCACGRPCGRKASKHPLTDLVPNGVLDATTDKTTIRRWWTEYPDANVGLALGAVSSGLVVVDVDAEDVGRLLREVLETPEHVGDGIAVQTPRVDGVHLYFRVTGDLPKSRILKSADNRRLGEVRSSGYYVVAPPSHNVNGNSYRFLGSEVGELPKTLAIPETDNFETSLAGRFEVIGVEVRPAQTRSAVVFEGVAEGETDDLDDGTYGDVDAVRPSDLPFSLKGSDPDSRTLRVRLSDHARILTEDRSGTLLHIACALLRLAHRKQQPIDRGTVAGILRDADERVYHKYDDRDDAGHWYLRTAKKAQIDVAVDLQSSMAETIAEVSHTKAPRLRQIEAQAASGDATVVVDLESRRRAKKAQNAASVDVLEEDAEVGGYFYSEGTGTFRRGAKSNWLLWTFKIQYTIEIQNIDEEDENDEPQVDYQLTLTQDGQTVDIILPRTLVGQRGAVQKRVAPFLPAAFVVFPGAWDHLWPAASLLTDRSSVLIQHRYLRSGWHVDEDGHAAFILPGAQAAIGADGFDESIAFAGFRNHEPQNLMLYGKGVRPPMDDDDYQRAEVALKHLLLVMEPEAGIPVLAQIFAGPLASLGMRESPPLVNLFVRSGQFKSAFAMAALSIFGSFDKRLANGGTIYPDTWESTPARLSQGLHTLRDLTFYIDDYKPEHVKNHLPAFYSFIQTYGDGTTRGRMGSDQTYRRTLHPGGLILTTGEQRWDEREESIQARTLAVPLIQYDPSAHSDEYQARLARIDAVQEQVLLGHTQLIGGAYLRWLARLGLDQVRERLIQIRKEELDLIDTGIHARSRTTAASLLAAERFVGAFIKMTFPNLRELWCDLQDQADDAMHERLAADGVSAQELTPFRQLIESITNHWGAREIRFNRRGAKGGEWIGNSIGKVIGFYDEGGIYLTQDLTWIWYDHYCRERGNPPPFTWTAVRQDARNNNGADKQVTGEGRVRSIYLRAESDDRVQDILAEAPHRGTTDLADLLQSD